MALQTNSISISTSTLRKCKLSQNPTVSRTGQGFGDGQVRLRRRLHHAAVVVIAVGSTTARQPFGSHCGNSTAATLSNPIAMTCAAVGAIYYGWGALSDKEREEILDRLSTGLEVGIEFIRSVVRFVIDKTKEVLSSKNITEFKDYIAAAADVFGRTLGDVTKKLSDMATDFLDLFRKKSGEVAEKTGEALTDAYGAVVDTAIEGAERTKKAFTRSSKPKSPKAMAAVVPEATPGIAPKVQRKRVRDREGSRWKPRERRPRPNPTGCEAKADSQPQGKVGVASKTKRKPVSPSRAGEPKLA